MNLDSKIFDVCLKKYNGVDNTSWNDLAARFDYSDGEKLRCAFKRERVKQGIPPKNQKRETSTKNLGEEFDSYYNEKIEMKDNWVKSDKLIEIHKEDLKSPERMLALHGFDPELWDVYHCLNNLWHAQRKDDLGRGLMYQSKLTAKPKKSDGVTPKDIESFFENFESKNISPARSARKQEGLTLEVSLPDLHYFAEPHGEGTVEQLEDALKTIVFDICEKAKLHPIKKIIFVLLGDTLHYDTKKRTTTYGTQIESPLSYEKMFNGCADLLISCIDTMKQIADVEIIWVPGNHDGISGFSLVKAIEFYYRKDDGVSIDVESKSRKYRVIGIALVGFMHGNISKANSIAWLHTEAREALAVTSISEIHAAHIHHQTTIEKDGVILRHLPTITNTDGWHHEKGFVGSLRTIMTFLWDDQLGLKEIWYFNK